MLILAQSMMLAETRFQVYFQDNRKYAQFTKFPQLESIIESHFQPQNGYSQQFHHKFQY